jgi:hypothetical protein
MFDRFRDAYEPGERDRGGVPWRPEALRAVKGYDQFAKEFAGASFRGGLYRIHDEVSGPRALALAQEAFPAFARRIYPFGYDWLGRQFAIDLGRLQDDQPLALLLEPGTGEALEVPVQFEGFHEEELIDYAGAALAVNFFGAWSAANPGTLPLGRDQCVGYKVPLFLGGPDVVDNLEVDDIDVYWSICGQLVLGSAHLHKGANVSGVEIS